MLPARTPIARHIAVAKQLLGELEQQSDRAMQALGRDGAEGLEAVVEERNTILGKLDDVVEALAHHRGDPNGVGSEGIESSARELDELARRAVAALDSHGKLIDRARTERDRIGTALRSADRPDAIATQYSATSQASRLRTLSVTG